MDNVIYDELINILIGNIKTLFYPEEWLRLDMELSKTELFALVLVDRHGEIIMSQLADYISIPMSTATGIIDRLVRNGYLKRERSETDRRIVSIQLADKGKTYMAKFKQIVSEFMERMMKELTAEEKTAILSIVTKAMNNLQKMTEQPEQEVEKNQVKKISIEYGGHKLFYGKYFVTRNIHIMKLWR